MPQHCDPWVEDGNVDVVSADDSKAFRVHRSILSRYSQVFKDMFAASHEGESSIEGCPVVRLQDAADDIEHVLCALYGRGYHIRRVPATTVPFPVVAAFLRLGKKYEIKELYEEARACLMSDFPDTLSSWQSRTTSIVSSSRKALAINVVNLAQEGGILRVLPAAFYECLTQCSLRELECGVKGEGEIATLTPKNRETCVSAWKPFEGCAARTYSWLKYGNITPTQCHSHICVNQRYWTISLKLYPTSSCQPLDRFDHSWNADVCSSCSNHALSTHNSNRVQAWNDLPTLFDLPGWN